MRLRHPILAALVAVACSPAKDDCEGETCASDPMEDGTGTTDQADDDDDDDDESGSTGGGGDDDDDDDDDSTGGDPPAACEGPLAQGVSLREVTFFQVVAVPGLADGGAVAPDARPVPLVAGRDAVLRARLDVGDDFTPRDLGLRVQIDGAAGAHLALDQRTISGASDGGDPRSGFLVDLPAEAMTGDATYSVSVVECGAPTDDAPPDAGVGPRFPARGDAPLAPVDTGPIHIHLVPFEVGGFVPDTSPPVLDGLRDAVFAVYPVIDVELSVGPVVPDEADGDLDMGVLLVQTGIIQESVDEAPPDVYYYGLVTGARTREEFCDDCPTGTSESGNGNRAGFAIGAAFADQRAEDTLIHELGHMHGLLHAPCGDPDLLDRAFPVPDASIATEGYDARTDEFITADHKDLMAYCYPRWIGEYHYAKLVEWVQLAQTWAG